MGKGGTLSDSVIKKIVLSYSYVAIWIFLSFTVIVYNKYILDKKMYNWPFPISLTMIHMSFCSSLAFLIIKVFKFVEPVSMSRETYLRSVVPIGALYALSLWLSNSAYIYLSVSFIQMLKALMPVAVYSIGVLFKKEGFKSDIMMNMLSISFGVAIAAYGEARFDVWGVILQLGAVAFEATRLVLIQILLTSKGITLNPITSLYYVAPCCLAFLFIPWIYVEFPVLRDTSSFHFDYAIFGANSICAFALNLAVFLLVGKTSALTMNVAGVVKDWLLIAFSWSVIKDTVTPINLFGYGIAFLGVAYYNHAKLQALKANEAQKKIQQADEEMSLCSEMSLHLVPHWNRAYSIINDNDQDSVLLFPELLFSPLNKSLVINTYDLSDVVSVGEYKVKARLSSTLQSIVDKYTDITSKSKLQSLSTRTYHLETLAEVVMELQSTPLRLLSETRANEILAIVKDIETAKIQVGWFRSVLEEVLEATRYINRRETVIMEKEVCEHSLLLARQEMVVSLKKLAEKEKEMNDFRERLMKTTGKLGSFEMKQTCLGKRFVFLRSKVEKFQSQSVFKDIL